MNMNSRNEDTPGRFVNMYHLRSRITDSATCWQAYEEGWHALEVTGDGTRRWSEGTGAIVVVMDEPGDVQLSGMLDSIETPNEVRIRVNGVQVRTIPIDSERYRSIDNIPVSLNSGPNLIEFMSMRPPIQVEGDQRDLSVAVINLNLRSVDTGEFCTWREDPANRPDTSATSPSGLTPSVATPAATPAGN